MSVASNLYATPRRQFIHRPFIHSCFLSFGTIKPVPSRIVQCPGTRRKYEMKKAREGLAEGGASDNNFFFSLSDTSDKPNRLGMLFYLGGGGGGVRALLVVEEITSWYRVCKCGDGGLIRRGGRKTS